MKSILGKLLLIQTELKAPKNQTNNFGKYKYRSCEDILEYVKPLLKLHSCTLIISDEVQSIGNNNYIKSTAVIYCINTGESLQSSGLAREAETKKGMDDAQITGSASSYARKYCLNGLLCIDDSKEIDAQKPTKINNKPELTPNQKEEWAKVVNFLKDKYTIAQIQSRFVISHENIELLKKEVANV